MKCTKVQETIQKSLSLMSKKFPLIQSIVADLQQAGARVFLVGGAVRDIVLEKEIKDLDIEVHGITLQHLEKTLKKHGHVRLVGKAFGVLRVDGFDVDWSIPRSDSAGRYPKVVLDQSLSVREACRRRDLTMNAMMIDMATGQLEDPFNGLQDMQDKVLRTPDPDLFIQDPLRFYRVMQFAGRFQMVPDQQLTTLCATMDISDVSQERIVAEFEKLFLKSTKPSIAFEWLMSIGRLKQLLPELYATKGVMQNPEYHPEGDVFEHTMQAVDGAAQQTYETDDKRLIMVLAALCHDLGKVVTSRIVDGAIRSHGHDVAGVPLADTLFDRVMTKTRFKKAVLRLVRYHMVPVSMVKNNGGAGAYKMLACNLAPDASLKMLSELAIIDKSARNPERGKPLSFCPEPLIETFLCNAQKYGVADYLEAPILMGQDIADQVTEGPLMGKILKRAYEIQLEEGITDKKELKKRVLKNK